MDIAYQVFGDAPLDLLVLPGPFIPIDTIDAEFPRCTGSVACLPTSAG